MTDITELIKRTVGLGTSLETLHGEALWTVCVDARQLENALLNLCLNARDAMLAGGRIVIETGTLPGHRDGAKAGSEGW